MEKLRRVLALLLCLLLVLPLAIAEENDAPAICVEEEIAAAIEALPEPETEPVPEPTAEATPEITVSVPEPTPEAEIAPTAEATAAPSAEAAAGATAVPAPEAGQEATPAPQPEATLDPTPEVLPEPTAVPYPRMVADDGEVVLGVKEKHALQVGFDDGAAHELHYISLDKEVAKISNSGVITAISVGETEMMIESEFGESISVPVTVKKAPSKLALNVKELHLGEGQSFQLLVSMPEDSAGALEWVSEKPKVASVDENGLVSACGAGAVYMRAECYNGEYASLMVYVYAAPEEISMRDEEIILGVGQPHTIALDSKLPQESYEFTSDHPEIVTVSANGAISALAAGEAVITASTYNGLSAECRVVVKPAPESIAFREQEIVICAKDSYSVQPLLSEGSEGTGYTLKSASRRFRLDGNRITAHSVGSSSLTVTTYNGHSASVALRCVAAPKFVAFDSEECTLFLGTETVPGLSAACSYTLESSNPAVVAVDGHRIRAVAAGDAQIRATTYNKKTAVLNVHVPPLPESLALQEAALVLGCGDTYQINPIIPEGQGSSFRFESSDPAVVSVDAAGRAEALRPGSAALTVHALNGLSASCEITVLEAPTAVSLSPARVVRSVEQGGFDLAICFGGEDEGGRYTIESSDPTVAAVAPDGRVTPLAPGSAVISIVTYNGLTAAARVTLGEQPSAMTFSGDLRIALGDCVLPGLIFDRGCESYILESGNPDVVQVEGDSIRAAAIGNTILRAESVGGLTAECRVAVVEPPTGIELSHSEEKLVLGVNPSLQLVGSALPAGAGSIRYASSNPAIAAVDAGGLVTALAMGDCIITATTYDGLHSAECIIHVRGVLDGVKIGIDPGRQEKHDHRYENISPTSTSRKHRVSAGTSGVATGIREYVTNLEIGLKLRDALEALGAEVHMTRTTHDVTISNQERAKMLNEAGVDLALRIHCNSATRRSIHGMCILVRKTGVGKEESRRAAELVLNAMLAETGAADRGVIESDKYTGLNWSTVPGMLLELGFMSNYREDRLLNSPEYQDKLVAGMVNGVCAYMGRPAPAELNPNISNEEAES